MDIMPSADERVAAEIRERLNEYNAAHAEADHHERLVLQVQKEGRLIGGLSGDTYWGWLYIDLLWVEEGERGRGIGAALLSRAEEIARGRGCRAAHLETHDFQNADFYLRRGYREFGRLADLPLGHSKFFLAKLLDAG